MKNKKVCIIVVTFNPQIENFENNLQMFLENDSYKIILVDNFSNNIKQIRQSVILNKESIILNEFAEGWNFGPDLKNNVSVKEIIQRVDTCWDKVDYNVNQNKNEHHEANLLMLDCSKANKLMKWLPIWDLETTIEKTINWYKEYYENNRVNTENDLKDFVQSAKQKSLPWTM